MNSVNLKVTDKEKYFGRWWIDTWGSKQCATASAKANSILGQMVRSLSYRNKTVWNSLLKTYVRPHLEYCVQVWNPWLVKDKEILEKIQKRAITLTFGLSGSTYEEKLKELGLISLENKKKSEEIWSKSGKYYMDMTMWTKTNGSALRMYQKKEEVYKPGSQKIL